MNVNFKTELLVRISVFYSQSQHIAVSHFQSLITGISKHMEIILTEQLETLV